MKVRLIGGIGSGKTYLAKKLVQEFGLEYCSLDECCWNNSLGYGVKRSSEERDTILGRVLRNPNWVIEGVYYDSWVAPTFKQADHVICLQVPAWKRRWRVWKRFVRYKLGAGDALEKSWQDVLTIIRLDKGWTKGIQKAAKKAHVCKSADEAYQYLKRISQQ